MIKLYKDASTRYALIGFKRLWLKIEPCHGGGVLFCLAHALTSKTAKRHWLFVSRNLITTN